MAELLVPYIPWAIAVLLGAAWLWSTKKHRRRYQDLFAVGQEQVEMLATRERDLENVRSDYEVLRAHANLADDELERQREWHKRNR